MLVAVRGLLRRYSSRNFPRVSPRSMNLDNPNQIAELIIVQQLDEQYLKRTKPERLVFRGDFCLWAKPFLPPNVTLAASGPVAPMNDSGRDAVVVPNRPVASGHAANVAGFDLGIPCDEFLRSCLSIGKTSQRTISLPGADDSEPTRTDKPTTAQKLKCGLRVHECPRLSTNVPVCPSLRLAA